MIDVNHTAISNKINIRSWRKLIDLYCTFAAMYNHSHDFCNIADFGYEALIAELTWNSCDFFLDVHYAKFVVSVKGHVIYS